MPFVGTEGFSMFKIIGAIIVYGFAIYGLAMWLKNSQNDEKSKGDRGQKQKDP